jgi:hypothetical protein
MWTITVRVNGLNDYIVDAYTSLCNAVGYGIKELRVLAHWAIIEVRLIGDVVSNQ